MNNEGKLLCERYHVLESAEHGMKCKDEKAGIFVWLKPLPKEIAVDAVMFDEAVKRCEALQALDHPNIVRMFGVVRESNDTAYMVMEYVEGITLRQWMREHRQDGAVPSKTAMAILSQLASSLDKAHSLSEIHRHLTPDCILIDKDGHVKILHYGIPRIGSDNDWMLKPWSPSGWEAFYRAPEQWRGQLAGPWTDLYALGCISYEMFAGRVPFDIPDIRMLRDAVLDELPPAIITQSTVVQKTISRCLAKNASERFRNCMDYIDSLVFETSSTGAVPRSETGTIFKNATDRVPGTGTIPTGAFIPSPKGTRPLRTTTNRIPAMLPDTPRTSLRNTTRAIDGSMLARSTSRIMSVDGEPELLPWENSVFPQNKNISLFFKLFVAVIFFVAVMGTLYFVLNRDVNQVEVEHLLEDQMMDDMAEELPEYADKLNDPIVRQRIRKAAYKYMELNGAQEGGKAEAIRHSIHDVMKQLQEEAEQQEDGSSAEIQVTSHESTSLPTPSQEGREIEVKPAQKTEKSNADKQLTPVAAPALPPIPDNTAQQAVKTTEPPKAQTPALPSVPDNKAQQAVKTTEPPKAQTPVILPTTKPLQEEVKKTAATGTDESKQVATSVEPAKTVDKTSPQVTDSITVEDEMAPREKIIAVINATIDGVNQDGVEISMGKQKFKTPCELEGKFGENRKVRAYYQNKQGVYRGEMFWEFNWHGSREIFIELKKMAEITRADARLVPLNDTVNMEMLWVPSGSFQMGSNAEDAKEDEKPEHTVQISYGFWLGKFEVTQEEYRAMAYRAGLDIVKPFFNGERLPMENITREAAEKWCEAVTRREREAGRLPDGYEYRLPTEAEWEFAARGGTKGRGRMFSGGSDLSSVGWFYSNSQGSTKPVGQKEPNELGFYDMSGNVREWCHDKYEPYSLEPTQDPLGRGEKDVARGGSWLNNKEGCRVTQRGSYRPNHQCNFIGFRVVLAPVLAE
ncbi:MAG: SUMF1/EgtB/PvdO family nonheme iron enzyme [Victivallales bacterium]|nr:SUMF1/EgtB/PvdO family nonheme iron enzyme [Victivallales bacterium]